MKKKRTTSGTLLEFSMHQCKCALRTFTNQSMSQQAIFSKCTKTLLINCSNTFSSSPSSSFPPFLLLLLLIEMNWTPVDLGFFRFYTFIFREFQIVFCFHNTLLRIAWRRSVCNSHFCVCADPYKKRPLFQQFLLHFMPIFSIWNTKYCLLVWLLLLSGLYVTRHVLQPQHNMKLHIVVMDAVWQVIETAFLSVKIAIEDGTQRRWWIYMMDQHIEKTENLFAFADI